MKRCCDMKGLLSFLVLRLISKQPMSGEDIRQEIEKRKGTKPSPGTIYPVLKTLSSEGWIEESASDSRDKKYVLTVAGKKEVKEATRKFVACFCDMEDEFKKK